MKIKSQLLTGACLAALAFGLPTLVSAAPKKSASPTPTASEAASPAAKAPRAIPFRGNATALDSSAKTFTIAGKAASRVFKVTDKSTLTKAGSPATFSDLTENEAVTGSYWKQEDGTLEVKSLKIGGKTEAEKTADAAKKAKKDAKKAEAGAAESPAPKN